MQIAAVQGDLDLSDLRLEEKEHEIQGRQIVLRLTKKVIFLENDDS